MGVSAHLISFLAAQSLDLNVRRNPRYRKCRGVHLSSKFWDVMASDVASKLSDNIKCVMLRGTGWAREA